MANDTILDWSILKASVDNKLDYGLNDWICLLKGGKHCGTRTNY